MTTYMYNRNGDFPSGFNQYVFEDDITINATLSHLSFPQVQALGDYINITYTPALTAGQKTELDNVVAAHDPARVIQDIVMNGSTVVNTDDIIPTVAVTNIVPIDEDDGVLIAGVTIQGSTINGVDISLLDVLIEPGQLLTHDGTQYQILDPGTDGQVLSINDSLPNKLQWIDSSGGSSDIFESYSSSTSDQRIGQNTDSDGWTPVCLHVDRQTSSIYTHPIGSSEVIFNAAGMYRIKYHVTIRSSSYNNKPTGVQCRLSHYTSSFSPVTGSMSYVMVYKATYSSTQAEIPLNNVSIGDKIKIQVDKYTGNGNAYLVSESCRLFIEKI